MEISLLFPRQSLLYAFFNSPPLASLVLSAGKRHEGAEGGQYVKTEHGDIDLFAINANLTFRYRSKRRDGKYW